MKSIPVVATQLATAKQYNDLRQDAKFSSYVSITEQDPISMDVNLNEGNFANADGDIVEVAASVITGILAPTTATHSWYLLLSLNSLGVIVKTYGTSAITPSKPDLPVDTFACAYILIAQGQATISDTDILDARSMGLGGGGGAALSDSYTTSNVTPDRILDANNVSLNELSDVVGTVIEDMRVLGGTTNINDGAASLSTTYSGTKIENEIIDNIPTLLNNSDLTVLTGDITTTGDIIANEFIGGGAGLTSVSAEGSAQVRFGMEIGETILDRDVVGVIDPSVENFNSDVDSDALNTTYPGLIKIDTDKYFATWDFGTTNCSGIVFTLVGEIFTYGVKSAFHTGEAKYGFATKIDTNKVFITYQNIDDGYKTYGIVGTISGTTITYGTPTVLSTTGNFTLNVTTLGTDKVMVVGGSTGTNCIVCTISGTTITAGTQVNIGGAISTGYGNIEFISTDKVLVSYYSGTDCMVQVCTISGTTITAGTAVSIYTGVVLYTTIALLDTDKLLVSFRGDSAGRMAVCNVSGTTITAGTTIQYNGNYINYHSIIPTSVTTARVCSQYGIDEINIDGNTITAIRYVTTSNGNHQSGILLNGNSIIFFTSNAKIFVYHSKQPVFIGKMQTDGIQISGIAMNGGINGDIISVANAGIVDGFTGLIPGVEYNSGADGIVTSGVGKNLGVAITDTKLQLAIQIS